MTLERGLVLLTGASGMIGIRILHFLLLEGFRVRVALRSQAKADRVLAHETIKPHAHLVETCIVPDIAVPWAFDEAARGCWGAVHTASPVVKPEVFGTDYQETIIKPAVEGTVNLLAAATMVGIKRVVITSSVGALTELTMNAEPVVDETFRAKKPKGGPYAHPMSAYLESKILAFQAAEAWLAHHQPPHLTVHHIMPGFVIGRNVLATRPEEAMLAANRLVVDPLLGNRTVMPMPGWTADVDDTARIHVRALLHEGKAHDNFIAVAHGDGVPWSSVADIAQRRFATEIEEGIFSTEAAEAGVTTPQRVDGSKVGRVFGLKMRSFEEQVVDVLSAYVELRRRCT